jgi:hypothetical protein
MDRFACGYCGTEMIVHRRGGTVALKAVTEAIERVRVGTDKTAAELAIARCEKELQAVKTAIAGMDAEGSANTVGAGCAVLMGVFGFFVVASTTSGDATGAVLIILFLGLLVAGFSWAFRVHTRKQDVQNAKLTELRNREAELAKELEANTAILRK